MAPQTFEAIPYHAEADTFRFRGSLAMVRHAMFAHLWLVLATSALATGLVVLYIWIWPPTYQAEVMIAADSEKDLQRQAFYQGWNIFRREGLTDESTLMVSPPVLKQTILKLDLRYEDVYHPFVSYATHLWSVSWVGNHYRAAKAWFFPPKANKYTPTPEEIEKGKVLKDFQQSVAVRQMGDASIGLLVVQGSNQRVAEIANTLIDTYLAVRRDGFVQEAQQAYDSLKLEGDRMAVELAEHGKRMEKFRSKSGMLLMYEKDRVQMGQWLTLQSDVNSLGAQIAENEHMLEVITAQVAGEGAHMGSDHSFADTAAKERLTRLEAQLGNARQLFQPGSPEVRDVEEQIALVKKEVQQGTSPVVIRNSASVSTAYETLRIRQQSLESTLAGERAALAAKQAEFNAMSAAMHRLPQVMETNHELERQQIVLESNYKNVMEKMGMAAVSLATARSAPSAMRVIEYASAPEQPVWPSTKLLILAAIGLGMVVGLIGALLLELTYVRANRYRLMDRDSEYRVLAVVPRAERLLERLYQRGPIPRISEAVPT
jgi:uncharacterized protein involved in exopolysaccharide biosynthesis